jgi:hypothetical protein
MRKLLVGGTAACIAAMTTFGGSAAVAAQHHQPHDHISNGEMAWLQGNASLDEFQVATANPDGSHLQFPGQNMAGLSSLVTGRHPNRRLLRLADDDSQARQGKHRDVSSA